MIKVEGELSSEKLQREKTEVEIKQVKKSHELKDLDSQEFLAERDAKVERLYK